MFDKEPNIDIVFRNGLKNLEILPPADVWENIPALPRNRRRYAMAFRIAAGMAALVTLTLLASWFTRNNGGINTEPQLASVVNDNITPAVPDLQEQEVIKPDTREILREEIASVSQASIEEASVSNSADISLSTMAYMQDEPEAVSDKQNTQVAAESPVIIISQRVFGLSEKSGQLATIEKIKPQGDRFFLGASVSPSLGFSGTTHDNRLAELLSSEKGVPTYSTGLIFAYKLSQRFSIQSGISMASLGQVVSGIDVFAGLSDYYATKGNYIYRVETASGTLISGNSDLYLTDNKSRVGTFVPSGMADPSKYPLTLIDNEIHQVFRYLEVPLLVRYKIIDRDLDLNLSGGMSYGFLVQNSAFAMDGNNMVPVGHTEGVNLHTLSSQIGVGMEYNFSKVISFNLEPVFRYYMTPFSDLSGTLSRPFSFGLFSGFFFRF